MSQPNGNLSIEQTAIVMASAFAELEPILQGEQSASELWLRVVMESYAERHLRQIDSDEAQSDQLSATLSRARPFADGLVENRQDRAVGQTELPVLLGGLVLVQGLDLVRAIKWDGYTLSKLSRDRGALDGIKHN